MAVAVAVPSVPSKSCGVEVAELGQDALHADDAVALGAPRHEDAERGGGAGLCGLDGRGLGSGVELRLDHRRDGVGVQEPLRPEPVQARPWRLRPVRPRLGNGRLGGSDGDERQELSQERCGRRSRSGRCRSVGAAHPRRRRDRSGCSAGSRRSSLSDRRWRRCRDGCRCHRFRSRRGSCGLSRFGSRCIGGCGAGGQAGAGVSATGAAATEAGASSSSLPRAWLLALAAAHARREPIMAWLPAPSAAVGSMAWVWVSSTAPAVSLAACAVFDSVASAVLEAAAGATLA